MNGILLLNKPLHISSFQLVSKVKRLLGIKKIGHGGTLDPLASGMLPICLGEATKFARFLLDADKSYTVTARMGVKTTTGDAEGEVVSDIGDFSLTEQRIQAAISALTGQIEQTPPMYSALKHKGRPLYSYARAGEEIERKQRTVNIYDFSIVSWQQPFLTCRVRCSKGTYIRSLLESLGDDLAVGASLFTLHRDSVAPFVSSAMISLTDLESLNKQGKLIEHVSYKNLTALFALKPRIDLSIEMASELAFGRGLDHVFAGREAGEVALFVSDEFFGIANLGIDARLAVVKLSSSMALRYSKPHE